MRLRDFSERIRHSLWFIPTLFVLAAGAAAIGMVWLSGVLGQTAAQLPLVFGAGPDGARAMLQAIAGSVITVAGVTFSITIVALQLTSTQFSPRVLRNFLRDRLNQLVLGTFMGTFTYALLVLRSIRAEDELRGPAFVPGPAITVGLGLAFLSLGMLIFFIHHISIRIQVTSILASVAGDALGTIRDLAEWSQPDERRGWVAVPRGDRAPAPPSGARPAPLERAGVTVLTATESGYLQLVDIEALVEGAAAQGCRYDLLVVPGAWVQVHAPVGVVEPADDPAAPDHARRVMEALIIGNERSLQQDAAFGIQQLVDIGVKALSPSVNDPTTAMNAIDRILDVLVHAGRAPDTPRTFGDTTGTPRLTIPFPDFDALVRLGFDQVIAHGGATAAIATHLARAVTLLRAALPSERHDPIRRLSGRLLEEAERIEPPSVRQEVLAAVRPLLD